MVIVTVFRLRTGPIRFLRVQSTMWLFGAVPRQDMVMVAINVTVHNNAEKPSWVHTIRATLDTGKNKLDDDASPAVDAQRYFQAFPALKQHVIAFLMPGSQAGRTRVRRPEQSW